MSWWSVVIGVVLNLLGASAAWRKEALTSAGAVTAFVVGMLVYLGFTVAGWLLLMVFFVSSTALGRIESSTKKQAVSLHAKGGKRDPVQVIANGGLAALAGLWYTVTDARAAVVVFVAALATANADTWAGEIGMLSRQKPRSIVTFQPVPAGQSGGVTLLGTAGGLAGALLIGLVAAFIDSFGLWGGQSWLLYVAVATAAGFVGSLLDSVIGTTLQVRYIDRSGRLSEKPGHGAVPAGGITWITNDVVNMLSGAGAATLAALVSPLVG